MQGRAGPAPALLVHQLSAMALRALDIPPAEMRHRA